MSGGREPEDRRDADVEEELSFHIEMRTRELVARGEARERARELALLRFGDVEASRRECVDIDERRERMRMNARQRLEMGQDIRYALRMLARRPGFTAVAVLTLALGIGANSAIFSVVNAVLLKSLPFRAPEQLYVVRTLYPDGQAYTVSPPDFMSLRARASSFDALVALAGSRRTLLGDGEPRELRVAAVTDGFFDVIGMPMARGRGFLEEESEPGRGDVVVVTDAFWRSELGADESVLGRTLNLSGTPYTVVGVLRPTRGIGQDWQLYAPIPFDSSFSASTAFNRRSEFLLPIGRLKSGVTADRLEAELRSIGGELKAEFPNTNNAQSFTSTSLMKETVGDVDRPLLVLLGAVGLVLLIACANVANLLLARASTRRSELAVRAALGAGRGRLVRQLVIEALVLGVIGGACGLGLAWAATKILVAAQPADIPRLDEVGVDRMVAGFTLGLALLTGLVFGVLPALHATGRNLTAPLREGGRGSSGGGNRLRSALVVAEIALAVVLLTGSGLLGRSFLNMLRVDPGFRSDHGLSMRLVPQGDEFTTRAEITNFFDDAFTRIEALPGVTAVAGTSLLPLTGLSEMIGPFSATGREPPPGVNLEIAIASVTPGYFDAIGARLLNGRDFDARDRADSPPVGLLNRAAVVRWFNGENPIGRTVSIGTSQREIVGVVDDLLDAGPGSPPSPQLYVPHAQRTTRALRVVVRTGGDPLQLAAPIRATINALNPDIPVSELMPLEQLAADAVARPRFYTLLLAIFAAVAVTLSAVGVFGVMSYSVAQRGHEISVRMALGARRGQVVSLIVARAGLLAAAGLAIGLALAFQLSRFIAAQLYGVRAFDAPTWFGVLLVLAATAGLASFLPARRAAGVDPGDSLRGS